MVAAGWVCLLFVVSVSSTFLDVGSSGTKITKPGYSNSLFAFAKDDSVTPVRQFRGMAAAFYADNRVQFSPDPDANGNPTFKFKTGNSELPLPAKDDNKEVYLKTLFTETKNIGDCKDMAALATAGMRVPEIPATAMQEVCNYDFAANGLAGCSFDKDWCRVTPGTEEGFYEWVAIQTGKSRFKHTDGQFYQVHSTGGPSGILSMGGASAQLAVPLTAEQKKNWNTLIGEIKSQQDKYFTSTANPRVSEYWQNYIDIFDPQDTRQLPRWHQVDKYWKALGNMRGYTSTARSTKGGNSAEYVAVGVISFLGLADSHLSNNNLHRMGGANALRSFFNQYVLGTGSTPLCNDFSSCFRKYITELKKDPFVAKVVNHLHSNGLVKQPFVIYDKYDLTANNVETVDKQKQRVRGLCDPLIVNLTAVHEKDSKKKLQILSDRVKITKLSSDYFAKCTGKATEDYFSQKCAGKTIEELKQNLSGNLFSSCFDAVQRTALLRTIFGTDINNPNQKRTTVDITLLSFGHDIGDPAIGAQWVKKHTVVGRSGPISGGVCVAIDKKADKNARALCTAITEQSKCKDKCQWRTQEARQQSAANQNSKLQTDKQNAQNKKDAGLAKKLQQDEKNKHQACFAKSVVKKESCEKLKQCFWNAQQNKCKPLGCGDGDNETKCKEFAKMGCIWKAPGYCTVGPARGSFFGGQTQP